MVEARGLLGYLGSSRYSEALVKVFELGTPSQCQLMIEFIDGLRNKPFIPPNQPRHPGWSLAQITYATLQKNLHCVCSALVRLDVGFSAFKLSFYGILVESVRQASRGEPGCNLDPLLFRLGLKWTLLRSTCSILHQMFLTLVDVMVGCIANQPHPALAIECANCLISELKVGRAEVGRPTDPASSEDLQLTLHLYQLTLRALYRTLCARLHSGDPWALDLKVKLEAQADFHLLERPPLRNPPLELDTLPNYLFFTKAILAPEARIGNAATRINGFGGDLR